MKPDSFPSPEEWKKAFGSIIDCASEQSISTAKRKKSRGKLDDNTIFALHELVQNCSPEPSASDVVSFCDGFMEDWEKTGQISAAVQQLILLLNRPHIRALLNSTSDISSGRFSPILPEIPFEVDEDDGVAVKIVKIVRRDEPLGATIKSDQHGRVTIARVIAGGVADRTGCILEGDRVIEVNGVSVAGIEPQEILRLLDNADGGSVTFKLIPAEIHPIQVDDQSNIHLRAMFDYDGPSDPIHPCPEAALSFQKGDILELLVCNDRHWWQARCLGNGALASGEDERRTHGGVGVLRVGLIPSEAMQNNRKGSNSLSRNGTIGRGSIRSRGSELDIDSTYESVCRMWPRAGLVRPIVLIGPPGVGRNELKRRLLMAFPDKYATTVPHTSRPPRPHEQNGVDYHFVARVEMEGMIQRGEMVEFGEFKGNLYGTALDAVRKASLVATPLLTPHPLALRCLRKKEFAPIVIFVQPPEKEEFRDTRASLRARWSRATSQASGSTVLSATPRGFTELEIEQIITAGRQLERQYGHLFDAKLTNGCLESSFSSLTRLLLKLETKPSWVPLSWATRDTD